MRLRCVWCILGLFAAGVFAQTVLTNEAIIKMAKAGLGEEIILATIKAQPGKYVTGPDDLIALKSAGVTEKVIALMMEKAASAGPEAAAPTPAAPATPAPVPSPPPPASTSGPPLVTEVGVYYNKAGSWADLAPEVVNFRTGGVLKTLGTAGLIKGDINGRVNGAQSPTGLKTPVDLLVYTPEGVAITEYQLLRLRGQKNAREFRTVTGGVLHVSGGATRDALQFESKKLAPRTYEIVLPNLSPGEYGLLPPAGADSAASSGRIGKIYSFHLIE